jgi:hypothetical protein
MHLFRRLILVALCLFAPPAAVSVLAGPEACDNRTNNTPKKLLECVTVDGVRAHQAALQAIADANGGTRVSGSAGFNESIDYVAAAMAAAGYKVTIQPFEHLTYFQAGPRPSRPPVADRLREGDDYALWPTPNRRCHGR